MNKKILLMMIILIMLTSCRSKISNTEVTTDKNLNQAVDNNTEETIKISEENIGVKANDLNFPMLNGKNFVLSKLEGKPVLINVWATWCPPCVGEMPAFEKLKNEYKDKINIVAIDFGEKKEVVEKFIKEKKYTFDVALDANGVTAELYDFQGIPFTFLVDKEGKVVNIFRGSRGEEAQYNLYKNAIERVLR